jgi:hypothetical protein
MGLVVAGSVICTAFQLRHRLLGHAWVWKVVLACCIAAVAAAALAMAL